MQKLMIKNLKYKNGLDVKVDVLCSIIKAKLASAGIKYSEFVIANDTMTINAKDKLFTSTVENKIKLTATDPRLRKLGRDYLLSKRLNEAQYGMLFDALKTPFDDLDILCDIVYMDDEKTEVWRKGDVTTFPVINSKMLPKRG